MKIEKIKTAELIPYARNAKTHPPAQVAKIAGSIREFGFNNPVLIDKDNGIIAGHGRVLAAQQLKLEEIPCIRLSHLTDAQRRAYILADNKLTEAGSGWDYDMLKLEIEDLPDFEASSIGFSDEDMERIFAIDFNSLAPGSIKTKFGTTTRNQPEKPRASMVVALLFSAAEAQRFADAKEAAGIKDDKDFVVSLLP